MGDTANAKQLGYCGQTDIHKDNTVSRASATSALYETYVSTALGRTHRADREEFESYARHYRTCYAPHLPDDRKAKILDLGCGMGHFLYFLKQAGYANHWGIAIGA